MWFRHGEYINIRKVMNDGEWWMIMLNHHHDESWVMNHFFCDDGWWFWTMAAVLIGQQDWLDNLHSQTMISNHSFVPPHVVFISQQFHSSSMFNGCFESIFPFWSRFPLPEGFAIYHQKAYSTYALWKNGKRVAGTTVRIAGNGHEGLAHSFQSVSTSLHTCPSVDRKPILKTFTFTNQDVFFWRLRLRLL